MNIYLKSIYREKTNTIVLFLNCKPQYILNLKIAKGLLNDVIYHASNTHRSSVQN